MRRKIKEIILLVMVTICIDSYGTTINSNAVVTRTDYKFLVNDASVTIDKPIIIFNGRAYVPIRNVSKILSVEVSYDSSTKTIDVISEGKQIEFHIGSNEALVKVLIYNNSAYVPIRYLAETLGYSIEQKNNVFIFSMSKGAGDKSEIDGRISIAYNGEGTFSYFKDSPNEDVDAFTMKNEEGNTVKVYYVRNQLLFFSKEDISFEEVRKMMEKYDAIIVGYMSNTQYYQVEFLNYTYEKLKMVIEQLQEEEIIEPEGVTLNIVVFPHNI